MNILELGGNIRLTGFDDIDGGSMIILKKIIGNYARKMSDASAKFENLSIVLKKVHGKGMNAKFEINATLSDNGKILNSAFTDKNIFFTVDKVLSSVMSQQVK